MTWNNVQPPCNTCVHCAQSSQYHGNHLGSTLPHAAYLHPQVAILGQLLSMLPTDVAIGRTADVNEKAGVSLLVSETDVRSVGFDLPCSGDGRIPHHYDVIRLVVLRNQGGYSLRQPIGYRVWVLNQEVIIPGQITVKT